MAEINRYARTKKLLGQVLKEMKSVHEGMIQEALSVQKKEGGQIGGILVRLGHISAETLMAALGRQAGFETVDLEKVNFTPELLEAVDPSTAKIFGVVPVKKESGKLTVAIANPQNVSVLDDLRFMTGDEIVGMLAPEAQVKEILERHYSGRDSGMSSIVEEVEAAVSGVSPKARRDGPVDLADAEAMANSAPVIKLLQYILFQAIRDRASDVHLEPFEDDFKIRYRVDGVLYDLEAPPLHLAPALISRVKVMSGLDIAETRLPQDGRIEIGIGGRTVDLRVSTLPTMFGESCVLRVLDRGVVQLDLSQIGLREVEMDSMKRLLALPHGIVLVTGPTGSGKTTTLYSCLNTLNDVATKIITTEDPVEYELEGVVQIQVNEEIGVTYANCLRSILRQDPDVILVGEVRDLETAQIAVEASLTGHLVLSTLHTNDAPLAVTRLLDLGIEPFLVSATIEAIVAQRLVRRICTQCRVVYEPGPDVLVELEIRKEEVAGKQFSYGRGCPACNGTGYKGRLAIFETLLMSETIRQMIIDHASSDQLREQARREGMQSLREAGLLAIYDGLTTVEEVLRETYII